MQFFLEFEIASFIFLVILVVVVMGGKTLESRHTRLFLGCIDIVFVQLIVDILVVANVELIAKQSDWIMYLIYDIYYAVQLMVPCIYGCYAYFLMNKTARKKNRFLMRTMIFVIVVSVGLLVSSPSTKWVYYIQDGTLCKGPIYLTLLVCPLCMMIILFVFAMVNRKSYTHKQLMAMSMIIVVFISGIVVQILYKQHMLNGMVSVIGVYIMFFTLANPIYYLDTLSGAKNRGAFLDYVQRLQSDGDMFHMIAISMDNFKNVNELFGMQGGDYILREFAKKLQKYYGTERVFRYSGDVYVVVLDDHYIVNKELPKIRSIVNSPWTINDVSCDISACICLIQAQTLELMHDSLVSSIDYFIEAVKRQGRGRVLTIDEDIINQRTRHVAIEHAMQLGIEKRYFEIHYQPIFDAREKRFCSMEALIRLKVEEYGYIPPDEFIAMAERNGMILDIGMIVIEQVCKFIQKSNLKMYGISFVDINLSVVQCMQDKLHKQVTELIESYNVPADMINFEITESAAANSEERLIQNMARLSLADYHFSLDDYGSGYSNINYLVDLPFHIVKLDKYFVWGAFEKVRTRRVLEQTIAMFKNINLRVVAEGVETKEQAEALMDLGVDYLQGYYYSKPIPGAKVIALLGGHSDEA